MTIELAQMSGAGNTFVVIDNRRYKISIDEGKELAQELCAASESLPRTEGLILLDYAPPGSGLHFIMRYFNPDGTYGAMCGNGARCAVHYAERCGFFTLAKTPEIYFAAPETSYKAEIHRMRQTVRLYFPEPEEIAFPLMLTLEGGAKITAGYVNVGSDHAVIWFPEIGGMTKSGFNAFDIDYWGGMVRRHEEFANGANANFYTIIGEQTIRLRTFERGVEAETGACGTGALSTAIIAHLRHEISPPIRIIPPSGSELTIHFFIGDRGFDQLSLEGGAEVVKTVSVTV